MFKIVNFNFRGLKKCPALFFIGYGFNLALFFTSCELNPIVFFIACGFNLVLFFTGSWLNPALFFIG
jgi:hypothetical protein